MSERKERKTSRKTSSGETVTNRQISDLAERLEKAKVKDTARGPRKGRRNTPAPLPAGKTIFRHGARSKNHPCPPEIVEGKAILDRSGNTSSRREHQRGPVKARAFSESAYHDIPTLGAGRDYGMVKRTSPKEVLPSISQCHVHNERSRPLAMPVIDPGSSKILKNRQSMGDKTRDSKTRAQRGGKGPVKRSKTVGDLNSKTMSMQGVRPKMTHKNSQGKQLEAHGARLSRKVYTVAGNVSLESSEDSVSIDNIDQQVSSDSLSEVITTKGSDGESVTSPTFDFPVVVSETITAIERNSIKEKPVDRCQPSANLLDPSLPSIHFRPATPVPRETNDESVNLAIGRLLRQTVCQAAVRQEELERLGRDIEEYNEINVNLQSQVGIAEG